MLFGYIFGAMLADRYSVKLIYTLGNLNMLILMIPLVYMSLCSSNISTLKIYTFLFLAGMIYGSYGVLTLLLLAQYIPVNIRYFFISLSFSLASLFFIGIPPFIFSLFQRETEIFYPVIIFIISCFVQLISVIFFHRYSRKSFPSIHQ